MPSYRAPNFEEFTRYMEKEIYRSFNLGGFADAMRRAGASAYDRPFYGDGGMTPPVGAWTPGDKLLTAVCRVEDESFNMAAMRPGLLQAINRVRNDGRQVFDCRLGPGGVYHPEEVRR